MTPNISTLKGGLILFGIAILVVAGVFIFKLNER